MIRINYIILFFTLMIPGITITGCNDEEDPVPITDAAPSRTVIQDSFEGEQFVVYANSRLGTMQAYNRQLPDGTLLDFSFSQGTFPTIMTDNEGNLWDVFGRAVSGPRVGDQLQVMNTMMGFWFSFAAMFPEVTLYGENEKETISRNSPDPDWLIDPNNVVFATFKDGIQSLDFPQMEIFNTAFKNENYINNNELVIVYKSGESIRVFPHKVLDWHEIVNDETQNGENVVSYCPLTGTASVWNSNLNGTNTSFGVSGLLYNSNLVLYDRATDSYWPQMLQKSVFGDHKGKKATILPYLEMTWEGARKLSEKVTVLSEDTGFGRDYDQYPYGDYRTDHDFISYPLNYKDDRVPNKERVIAVLINEKAKAYRFSDFE